MIWQELAACSGVDSDVFFPTSGRNAYREARSYCGRCPVRRACLEDALHAERDVAAKSNHRHGMFGGATPDERGSMHWLWEIKVAHPDRELVAA